MRTNAARVADALVSEGIDTVFGLMGNGNLELIADLIDTHGVRYISARHESAAVAAADGYARAGERIGVATVTHGPGLTNAVTALVTARRASTPLLLIAGDASGYTGRSTQRLDQKRLAAALDIPCLAPEARDDWGRVTRQALSACRDGAVLLNLPAEALSAPAGEETAPITLNRPVEPVDLARLSQIAEEFLAAKRPLILAGRGVLRSGTGKAAEELARRTGARLGTSLAAKGLFAGMPGDIGMVGGLGSPESTAACRDCDLVLVLGASLNGFTTEHGTLFRAARVLRLDNNVTTATSIPVDISVSGDLATLVPALLDMVSDSGREPWSSPVPPLPNKPRTWPDQVFSALDRLLPAERTITFDHGDLANSAIPHFTVAHPSQSLFMPDFGSLGLSVAAAIGAAAAVPERRTVAIVGDGGLMMALPDLDMLYRSGLPVLIVVMNDGVYGAEYPHLRRIGASPDPARFDSRPIADIADAIGLSSAVLTERDDLNVLAEAIADQSGPRLIEIRCPPPS